MGKAKVWSHLGDGLYQVSYYQDLSYSKTRIKELNQQIYDLEIKVYGPNGLSDLVDDAENTYNGISSEFLNALDLWAICARDPACTNKDDLLGKVRELGQKRQEAGLALSQNQMLLAAGKVAILNAQGERAYLENTSQEEDFRTMWCVEFPHDPEGPIPNGSIVGTAESYGAKNTSGGLWLPSSHANLLGNYTALPVYDCPRDHKITPVSGQSTATAIFNTLQFLNAMTNNPHYVVGTLQSKDENLNTGSVELFGETPSSDHPTGYPFVEGQFSIMLTDVPIVYQNCHAKVFDVGDQVVVRFEGVARDTPTVIGFATNPKECKRVTLTYSVSGTGGAIFGETSQEGVAPFDGTSVVAYTTNDTASFIQWSDGNTNPVRKDTNVQESAHYIAQFQDRPSGAWPTTLQGTPLGGGGGMSTTEGKGQSSTVGNVTTVEYDGAASCSELQNGSPNYNYHSIEARTGHLYFNGTINGPSGGDTYNESGTLCNTGTFFFNQTTWSGVPDPMGLQDCTAHVGANVGQIHWDDHPHGPGNAFGTSFSVVDIGDAQTNCIMCGEYHWRRWQGSYRVTSYNISELPNHMKAGRIITKKVTISGVVYSASYYLDYCTPYVAGVTDLMCYWKRMGAGGSLPPSGYLP